MTTFKTSPDEGVARAFKYYAGGGGLIDLTTVSAKPQCCARRITFMAAGSVAHLKDSGGNDEPGSVVANQNHDADTSAIDSSVAFWAYW